MKILDIFGDRLVPTDGEVGVEIEIEGRNLPGLPAKYWQVHSDGSLRGDEAREYVFAKPLPRDEVGVALNYLKDHFVKHDARIDRNTERTGVHAHINVQQLEEKQVVSFFCLYGILEDLIVKFCGSSREGNLFCLRLKDAEYLSEFLLQVFNKGQWHLLDTDKIRYASVNMNALCKYGSMEFRSMRGTDDMEQIKLWVDMLLRIKDKAIQYNEPRDIVTSLSVQGEEAFLANVMGEYAEILMCKDLDKILRSGVRRIQELACTPVAVGKKKAVPLKYKHRYIPDTEIFLGEEYDTYIKLADKANRGLIQEDKEWEVYQKLHDKKMKIIAQIQKQEKQEWEARVRAEAVNAFQAYNFGDVVAVKPKRAVKKVQVADWGFRLDPAPALQVPDDPEEEVPEEDVDIWDEDIPEDGFDPDPEEVR